MRRVFLIIFLGMRMAGCIPISTTTEGSSGPIAWHVTDLKSIYVPGTVRGTYSFTLVLKESQGTPITFTYRQDTIYASGVTVLRSADQAINLTLRAYGERRIPQTFSWDCPAGDCLQLRSVAPSYIINLTGSDDNGKPVQVVIKIRLPDNPDSYRKP